MIAAVPPHRRAKLKAAINDFSEAIRLKPDFALAYRNRTKPYDALFKKVEAKRDPGKGRRP